MHEYHNIRPESRYGTPTADLLLFNRLYMVGYSYLFRQPRWAMQMIDDSTMACPGEEFDRLDNFREDMRVPELFRSTSADYDHSGYDRGHLINSADSKGSKIINSETFLLSNISPQKPNFNRQIWLTLENAVRDLANKEEVHEVYTVCGPLFRVGDPIEVIGENKVFVPDAYFKCILVEQAKPDTVNQLMMWAFRIPNTDVGDKTLADFLVKTQDVEKQAGLQIWNNLKGDKADTLKNKIEPMWE